MSSKTLSLRSSSLLPLDSMLSSRQSSQVQLWLEDSTMSPVVFSLFLLLGGDIESNPGPLKERLKKQAKNQTYVLQREEILEKRWLGYAESAEPK